MSKVESVETEIKQLDQKTSQLSETMFCYISYKTFAPCINYKLPNESWIRLKAVDYRYFSRHDRYFESSDV